MNDIKWKEGVAFFVGGKQWREHACGGFILTKELDEQKYKDVVDVFGLFGFKWG